MSRRAPIALTLALLLSAGPAPAQLAAPRLAAPAAPLAAPLALPAAPAGLAAPGTLQALPALPPLRALPALRAPASLRAAPALRSLSGLGAGKGAERRAAARFDGSAFRTGAVAVPGLGAVEAPARGRKAPAARAPAARPSGRQVRFNGTRLPGVVLLPETPTAELLVQAIDAARSTVRIALYEFKLKEILSALGRARRRGVKVEILLDRSRVYPEPYEGADRRPHRSEEIQWLLNAGFEVSVLRGGGAFGIQHNKFAVLDGKLLATGSYNWSWTAERHHYENVVFTTEPERVKAHEAYWDYMKGLAKPFAEARDWPWDRPIPPAPRLKPSVKLGAARLPAAVFSPGGGAEDATVAAIAAAERSVDVSMFALRSTRVAEALDAARARGVKVRVILDETQAGEAAFRDFGRWLAARGIEVRLLAGPDPAGPEWYQKNHNKLAVYDGKVVQTGSFNFTKNASERSFENSHFLDDSRDAAAYVRYFGALWKAAKPLAAPRRAPKLPTDAELLRELDQPPPELPPLPELVEVPAARRVSFNGGSFPAYAFRPGDEVAAELARLIGRAKKTVRVAMYQFRLPGMLEALREARRRGVQVQVILDLGHLKTRGTDPFGDPRLPSPEILALQEEGFELKVLRGRTASGLQHNKFILADDRLVQYGSYNYAMSAETSHFESVLFDDDRERAAGYKAYWDYMWALALPPGETDGVKWPKRVKDPPPADPKPSLRFGGRSFPRYAFSPGPEVEKVLLEAVAAAKESVEVAMFSFYSTAVAKALLAAKERGVKVRIVVDQGQAKLMKLDEWFAWHGFDVKILSGPDPWGDAILERQHNKFMLVDRRLLLSGSFNYTGNALKNSFENVSLTLAEDVAAGFAAYFENLHRLGWAPSKPKKAPPLPEPAAKKGSRKKAPGAEVRGRAARRAAAPSGTGR